MSILSNSRGQGLIEYVILVAMVGVATLGMVRILQKSIKNNLADVVHVMQGEQKRQSKQTIGEDDLRKSDFSDFMNGAASK